MNLLRLSTTMSCRSRMPAVDRSSSFVMWSFYYTPIISRRHLLLNTVSCQLSCTFTSVDGRWDDNWCVQAHLCVFTDIFDLHTGRRRLCTDEAFPIRVYMSYSASSSLDMLLPRCWKCSTNSMSLCSTLSDRACVFPTATAFVFLHWPVA